MNYLSHFYIDERINDSYHNVGLILPDISKDHIKRYEGMDFADDAEMTALLNGCFKHYRADKLFHGSDFFKTYLTAVTDLVNHAGLSSQLRRKWFLAHVLFEIIIDRVILNVAPETADRFYESFDHVDEAKLKEFMLRQGGKDLEKFLIRFNHFRTARFIYYYTDNNKVVYSLNRIMQRIGMPEAGKQDSLILESLCNEVETTYFSNREQLLIQLRQIFE